MCCVAAYKMCTGYNVTYAGGPRASTTAAAMKHRCFNHHPGFEMNL